MRRVLIYASIYAAIGAMVGVCVALYTKDDVPLPKNIVLGNGSATKATARSSSSTPNSKATVAEPPITNTIQEDVTELAES